MNVPLVKLARFDRDGVTNMRSVLHEWWVDSTNECVLASIDLRYRWDIYMNQDATGSSQEFLLFCFVFSLVWQPIRQCKIVQNWNPVTEQSSVFWYIGDIALKCTMLYVFPSPLFSTVKKNSDNLSAYEKGNEKVPGAPPHYPAYLNAVSQTNRICIIAFSLLAFHLECHEYKVFSSTWKQHAVSMSFKAFLAGEWGHLCS